MHFGWAVLVAYGAIQIGRGPWRWLVIAHPVITLIAITATANHYWLDAAVAGLLIVLALAVTNRAPARFASPAKQIAFDAQLSSTR
jgi:hypothetical protein